MSAGTSERRLLGVVFDLDGTLVDSMSAFPIVYVRTIRLLGGPNLGPDDVIAALHLGSTAEVLAHFLGRPTTTADLDCFYEAATAAASVVRPFDGVAGMLDTLKGRGIKLGLLTGATRRTTELLLDSCGITRHFVSVVAGDEVSRPKPAPDGLLRVCKGLDVAPTRAAYVGDTQADIDCAIEAGCIAVLATWGDRNITAVGAHATAASPAQVTSLPAFEPRSGFGTR
jgi:HAD superfamily hydrolase (TIGR01509 family)